MYDGSVVIDTRMDPAGIVSGQKEIQGKLDGLAKHSNGLAQTMKKVAIGAMTAVSARAVGEFAKVSVEAAATARALDAQFDTVFSGMEMDAMNALKKIGEETNILPDRLKPAFTSMAAFAKTTGVDTADALALTERATMAAADGAAMMDKSIEEVTDSLQSFLKGNYENDAALGISATETTRNSKANELYGQSFKDLDEAQKQLTLLAMVEDGNKLSGALGQAAREGNSFENVLGNLKKGWELFQAAIGEQLIDVAIVGMEKLSKVLEWATQEVYAISDAIYVFWDKMKEGDGGIKANLLNWITDLVTSFREKMPELIEAGGEIIANLVNGIITRYPIFLEAWFNLIRTIGEIILENLPTLLDAGLTILNGIVTGILEALPQVVGIVLELLTWFVTTLMENMPMIFEKGQALLFALIDGIAAILPEIGAAALEILTWLINTLVENLPAIIAMGMEMLTSLISGIAERLPEIAAMALDIVVQLINTIIENLPDIIKAGVDIILSVIDGFISAEGDLRTALGEVIDIVKGKIKEINLFDIGVNIIQGLWNGIVSVKDWILGKLGGFVDDVLAGVKDFFGIASPSKLFRDEIGKFLPQGMAIGMEMEAGAVEDAADLLAKVAIPDVSKIQLPESTIQRGVASITQPISLQNIHNSEAPGVNLGQIEMLLAQIAGKDLTLIADDGTVIAHYVDKLRQEINRRNKHDAYGQGLVYGG